VLLVVYLLLVLCKYKSSSCRFNLLSIGLLSLLLMPVLVATLPRISVPLYLEMKIPLQDGVGAETGLTAAAGTTGIGGAAGSDHLLQQPLRSPLGWDEAWLAGCIVVVWGLVAVILLVRLGLGTARLRELVHSARPVTSGRLVELMYRLKNEAGIRRSVEIRMSGADMTPLTVGILKPMILVPEQINRWPGETCKAVLLHELFHIKRFDFLQHLLVDIVQALYWINPLVQRCAESFRAEQEVTCDDQVIFNGVKSKAYARQMLSVAVDLASPEFSLPFWNGAADRAELERRMLSILNAGKNRAPSNRRSLVWTLLFCLFLITPLSALRFTEYMPPADGSDALMQGCWAKLEGGNRLLLADDCRLLIDGVAYIQEGWKEKSLEFPDGSSFLAGGGELTRGYLVDERLSEIVVCGRTARPEWRLRFDPESSRVVMKKEPGGQSYSLECVNRYMIPDYGAGKYKLKTNNVATFVMVDIRDREQIFSNRLGMAFVVLALASEAPANQSGAGLDGDR
jgi:beta-lactamase regulating signal transducer with metallopeptidase domain